ncbi:MAG: tyrosine-type recombinase/integrase, partial [Planctomycetota bacterium]
MASELPTTRHTLRAPCRELPRLRTPRVHLHPAQAFVRWALAFLLSTGCRKGEALALKWQDIDFSGRRIMIRRALVRGRLGTPKSGRARSVVLSPILAAVLGDLLAERRR